MVLQKHINRESLVFLIRSLHPGGAERQLVELVKGLRARGYRVAVIVLYSGGALETEIRDADVEFYSLGKRGRWDVVFLLPRLVRLLRNLRPAVLHGYLDVPNILVALVKPLARVPVVFGIRSSYMDLSRYDWLTRIVPKLESFAARNADLVILNSEAGRSRVIQRRFDPRLLAVVPNGIDTSRFTPDPAARERLRGEWGVADSQRLVCLPARVDPMKDHLTFLRAAAMLARRRNDLIFVCVGAIPPESASIVGSNEAQALEGKLIWAGLRRDMNAVFNAADLVCLSSYGEGFPNVLAEAMATGTPCASTDVGDAARIVGDQGRVVPVRRPDLLAEAIETILENPPGSDQVRARIVENFGLEALVRSTEALLLGLIRSSARP
jgi:glycosyltransferase involved in cell wall biosynthesis